MSGPRHRTSAASQGSLVASQIDNTGLSEETVFEPVSSQTLRKALGQPYLIILILLVVYLPNIVMPFAHHDQYKYLLASEDPQYKAVCANNPGHYVNYRLGRPFLAQFECAEFKYAKKLTDINLFRAVCLLLIVGSALVLAQSLRRADLSPPAANLLVLAIMTLPGLQFAIFISSIGAIFAFFLGVFAQYLLGQAWTRVGYRRLATLASSSLLLLVGMLTYPLFAFSFLLGILGSLLFDRTSAWPVKRRSVVRDLVIFGVVTVFYYGILSFILVPRYSVLGRFDAPGYDTRVSLTDLGPKIDGVVKAILPPVLNLWNIYTSSTVAWAVVVILLVGLVVFLWLERHTIQVGRLLQSGGFLAGLILSGLVVFLAGHAFFLFRNVLVVSSLLVLLLGWALASVFRLFLRVSKGRVGAAEITAAACLGLLGTVLGSITILRNIANSYLELRYIEAQISASDPAHVDQIHIIRPLDRTGFNGSPGLTDEFNVPTTSYWFDLAGVLQAAWNDVGREKRFARYANLPAQPEQFPAAGKIQLEGDHVLILFDTGIVARGSFTPARMDGISSGTTATVSPDGSTLRWSTGAVWRDLTPVNHHPGEWRAECPDQVAGCVIREDTSNGLWIDGKDGVTIKAILKPAQITAGSVAALGLLSADGTRIMWSNHAQWIRSYAGFGVVGDWKRLPYNTNTLTVTSSAPGEREPPQSDNVLVIDMNALFASYEQTRHLALEAETRRAHRPSPFPTDQDQEEWKDAGDGAKVATECAIFPWGPEGLLKAQQPGWHCKPSSYPVDLDFQFASEQSVSGIALLPQDRNVDRFPKEIQLLESKMGHSWTAAGDLTFSCSGATGTWQTAPLPRTLHTRFIRFRVKSNCGNSELVTFRGVQFH